MGFRVVLASFALSVVLAGCAGMIEEIGPNEYRIALAPEASVADADRAEEAAQSEAEQFCARQGQRVKQSQVDTFVMTDRSGDGPSTTVKKTLTFHCK